MPVHPKINFEKVAFENLVTNVFLDITMQISLRVDPISQRRKGLRNNERILATAGFQMSGNLIMHEINHACKTGQHRVSKL